MSAVNFWNRDYVGQVMLFEGVTVNLIKMPTKKQRKKMEEVFGWRFEEYK